MTIMTCLFCNFLKSHKLRLTVIFHQTLHRVLHHFTQLEFIAVAKLLQHILKTKCDTPSKTDGQCPGLPVFTKVTEEKVIQSIFNNVLDHIMSAVFRKELRKSSQVAVRQRFFIYVLQNFSS